MALDNEIILGGGKVVLPLLTLGGIVRWINYYYRRRPTADDTKEDYLSQLSDGFVFHSWKVDTTRGC
ncbi:hypothetical protein P3L10_016696 [Capsicum annuum]